MVSVRPHLQKEESAFHQSILSGTVSKIYIFSNKTSICKNPINFESNKIKNDKIYNNLLMNSQQATLNCEEIFQFLLF